MADLIKKIKIKKQDGTFTDYIPIGAEAQNVSASDGDSVQLKLNKKPYYYNNVADMKADTKLKIGDMAVTLGYYEPNDGGGAEYKIVNAVSQTEYQEELNNNLYATLVTGKEVNVKQLGAYGDETHDDTSFFTTALSKFISVFVPTGTYIISNTLSLRTNQILEGNDYHNTKLTYTGTGNFIINADEDYNSYVTIKNLYIQSTTERQGCGIHLSRTTSVDGYGASWHYLRDLIVKGFDNGIIIGANQNETKLFNVNCRRNNIGLVVDDCGDLTLDTIVCDNNVNIGMDLEFCTETRIANSKCWWNGNKNSSYYNMKMNSCRELNVSNVTLQDAFGTNLYMNGCSRVSCTNIALDGPMKETTATCYQLGFKDNHMCTIHGITKNRVVSDQYTNKVLHLSGNCAENDINLKIEGNFPNNQLIDELANSRDNSNALKNTIILNNKDYSTVQQNYAVNGNFQDRTNLDFIYSGKTNDNASWDGYKLKLNPTSDTTYVFKNGAKFFPGLYTYYMVFEHVSGTGDVVFKGNSYKRTLTNDTIGDTIYTAGIENVTSLNRANDLSITVPANVVINIIEIGIVNGASSKMSNPLSPRSLA